MRYKTYRQNNSRGEWVEFGEKKVMYLTIPADLGLADVLDEKAMSFCPCCGERWMMPEEHEGSAPRHFEERIGDELVEYFEGADEIEEWLEEDECAVVYEETAGGVILPKVYFAKIHLDIR